MRRPVPHDDRGRHADLALERRLLEGVDVDAPALGAGDASRSTSAEATYSTVAKPWLKVRAREKLLEQRRGHRLAGPVVAREALAAPPAARASARRAARGTRRSRARTPVPESERIGDVRQQAVQRVAELVEQRAGIVEGRAASARPSPPSAKFMTLTMIGRHVAGELLLAAEARSSRRRCASRAGRNSRRGRGRRPPAAVLDLEDADIRVIGRNVGPLGRSCRPNRRLGRVEGGLDHAVELQVGLELALVEIELGLARGARHRSASPRARCRNCRLPRLRAPARAACSAIALERAGAQTAFRRSAPLRRSRAMESSRRKCAKLGKPRSCARSARSRSVSAMMRAIVGRAAVAARDPGA